MGKLYVINLDKIDWKLLIEQKEFLSEVASMSCWSKKDQEYIEGIQNLLDAIDDKINNENFILQL